MTKNELIEKAKLLGIKRPDLMREDNLVIKIKEAEDSIGLTLDAEEAPDESPVDESPVLAKEEKPSARPIAPSMNLSMISGDDRIKLIAKLEAEDPECKYVFKRASVSDDELVAVGLERTGQRLKNDIICRTAKDSFKEWQKMQNVAEYKSMKSIDGGTGKVKYMNANKRTPPELEEELLMEEN